MAQAATPIEEVVIEEGLGAASVEGLSEEEQAAVAVVQEATGVSDSLLCVSGDVLVASAALVEWLSETAIWNRDRGFDSKNGRVAKIVKGKVQPTQFDLMVFWANITMQKKYRQRFHSFKENAQVKCSEAQCETIFSDAKRTFRAKRHGMCVWRC